MEHFEKLFVMLFLSALLISKSSYASKILVFLPFYGTSHNLVTMPYVEELARRGHNVTVAGFFEPKRPSPNLKSLLLKQAPDKPLRGFLSTESYVNSNYMTTMYLIDKEILVPSDELIVRNKKVLDQMFQETYDLVVVELFESDLFLGFVAKMSAPFILIHSCEPFPWHRDTLGDPISPSLIPQVFSKYSSSMDFTQRFWNTLEVAQMMWYYRTEMLPTAQKIAEKHLGRVPPVNELTKDASLYMTNTHNSLYGPRPMNPATIEIGGIHLFPPKPLPEDLKTLLDNAKHGVIYFSMGSVLRGSSMNPRKRDAVLKVFSELKETVLWKWEDELPNKSPNIHTSPWFPQRDIFAHPNIVLYIGHCGLLGIHEAITEALPIICLPMFGDQHFNAAALKRNGMGLDLNYADITEDLFRETINKVLKNPSFKENAKRVSSAFLDRPMSAMDTAVYWTEYVIRHKGAPHLKSPARYMKWWEYYNLDVIGVLLLIVVSVVVLTYKMIKSFLTLLFCRGSQRKVKTN